jgi:uncharacterized repeat protein (TIGR03803 family)
MIDLRLGRYALGVCVTIAMLAGCGGSQDAISGAPLPLSPAGVTAQRMHVHPAYSVLHDFDSSGDGVYPYAGLISVSGTLYGTTYEGGVNGIDGTVFSITLSGKEKVLHRFAGGSGDGENPYAGLINVGGTLYGTTNDGGANNGGTVFSITPSGKEKLLQSFGGSGDGVYPLAGLISVSGALYGTTARGGANGDGTVFSMTTSGTEAVLYSFKGGSGDGAYPVAGLLDVRGTLYGTTQNGGYYNAGTVFSTTLSGKEKVLHTFGGSGDGSQPFAGLVDVKGTLYGTTYNGGRDTKCGTAIGCGTVFSVKPSGKESVLHSFDSSGDGYFPYAGLINVDGTLYGTTYVGGVNGTDGTVFSITLSGKEKVLHTFAGSGDGGFPYAGLINVKGTLYGTTTSGGLGYNGTVFSISP